jgi:hypothetical protein
MEKVRAFEFRVGRLSLEEYRVFLSERLQALQAYSPEWRRVYEQLYKVDQEALRKMSDQFRQQGRDGVGSMAQGLDGGRGLLRNALLTLTGESLYAMGRGLKKGVSGAFGDILIRTLTNVLADALENAIMFAFQRKRSASLQNGFVGGVLGAGFNLLGGFFGFDDAANDSRAKTWGWDFAKHFTRGVDSYRGQRGAPQLASAAPASQNHVTVNVNYQGRSDADFKELGRRIAWEVQQELRRSI